MILLPNGVINQLFYRDGSHKTPASLSKGKKEKKKTSEDKGLASKAEGRPQQYLFSRPEGGPRKSPASGEPAL